MSKNHVDIVLRVDVTVKPVKHTKTLLIGGSYFLPFGLFAKIDSLTFHVDGITFTCM